MKECESQRISLTLCTEKKKFEEDLNGYRAHLNEVKRAQRAADIEATRASSRACFANIKASGIHKLKLKPKQNKIDYTSSAERTTCNVHLLATHVCTATVEKSLGCRAKTGGQAGRQS